MESKKLEELEQADFDRVSGIKIRFEEKIEQKVISVKAYGLKGYSPLKRKPFGLELRIKNKGKLYPQGIYEIEHPEYGTFDLFMVPSSSTADFVEYQVIFS